MVSYIGSDGRHEQMSESDFAARWSGKFVAKKTAGSVPLDKESDKTTKGIFANVVDSIRNIFAKKEKGVSQNTGETEQTQLANICNGKLSKEELTQLSKNMTRK